MNACILSKFPFDEFRNLSLSPPLDGYFALTGLLPVVLQ